MIPASLHSHPRQLYVSASGSCDSPKRTSHPFNGYYLPYPGSKWGKKGEGLVSTINEQRHLNWIFVDHDTHEVRYGIRADAQGNFVGPYNCTKMGKRLTLDGWEGFMAVNEGSGIWALYFDVDGRSFSKPVL